MMKLAPQVDTALELLEAAGYEAYLVGGAVRDFVRDNSPAKDWDIATNALPEQVKAVFAGFRLIETGLKHGTDRGDRPYTAGDHHLPRGWRLHGPPPPGCSQLYPQSERRSGAP